jgi:glycerol uptake facilitator-like aquaporin
VRGAPGSEASAMILAEYFPNPGGRPLGADSLAIPEWRAFVVEAVGTAVLMMVILGVIHPGNRSAVASLAPFTIGLTVTALISLFAPLTMAAFNPARDLGPRIVAALAGWGPEVFRTNGTGWFTVYVLAPVVGAQLGGLIHAKFLAPAYRD